MLDTRHNQIIREEIEKLENKCNPRLILVQPTTNVADEWILERRLEVINKLMIQNYRVASPFIQIPVDNDRDATLYRIADVLVDLPNVDGLYFMRDWMYDESCEILETIAVRLGLDCYYEDVPQSTRYLRSSEVDDVVNHTQHNIHGESFTVTRDRGFPNSKSSVDGRHQAVYPDGEYRDTRIKRGGV